MKALVGALALLIVLAVVGFVVVRQTRALSASRAVLPSADASAPGAPPTSARAAGEQITRELGKAFDAASAARAQAGEP